VVSLGAASVKDVIQVSHLEGEVAHSTLKVLVASGRVINLDHRPSLAGEQAVSDADQQPSDLIAGRGFVDQLTSKAQLEVSQYYRLHPLKSGMPREELKSRLKVSPRLFSVLIQRMVDEKLLGETGPLVQLPGHEITFSPQQEKAIDQLLAQFAAAPHSPPTIKECQSQVGDDVYYALVDQGVLIPVNQEIVFNRMGYEQLVADVRNLIMKNGQITAAQMRDYWNTSRRYVLALLEYLDRIGVTVRDGDIRRLRN
jgi:selenocysteine-specific elongation factor